MIYIPKIISIPVLALACVLMLSCGVGRKDLLLATTTSVQDSGLLEELIPVFERDSGIKVKPVITGSGQALAMGMKGNVDALLTHSPGEEVEFVKNGYGIDRRFVMQNFFIIAGPSDDPAGIKGLESSVEAFRSIGRKQALFVSRGDKSGTHMKELNIWKQAGIDKFGNSDEYIETGTGMAHTLYVASEKNAYVLTDKATFYALREKLHLVCLLDGDKSLLNLYHVILVNPDKFPDLNYEAARTFADFLLSAKAQDIVANFGIEKYGESLFQNAGKQ